MDMSNDWNRYYEFLEFYKIYKEIMENSTTTNNIGLFQVQNVKKSKFTENDSLSNEVLPEDKFKNLHLNSVAKSEIFV